MNSQEVFVSDSQMTDFDDGDTIIEGEDENEVTIIPETQDPLILLQSDLLSQDFFEATQRSPRPNLFIELATGQDDQNTNSSKKSPTSSSRLEPPAKKQKLDFSPGNSPTIPLNDVTPSSPTKSIPIRGRVTKKLCNEFDKKNGTGKVRITTLTFADDSGEMKVKGFEDQAERLDTLQVDGIYELKNYDVKPAYKHDKSQYEIEVKEHTVIYLPHTTGLSSQIVYNYVPTIMSIASSPNDSLIDVKGMCHRVFDLTNVISKNARKELSKKDFTIVDTSNTEIYVTLWDIDAKKFTGQPGSLISIRKGKVGEFNNKKNLSIASQTTLEVDSEVNGGEDLKKWYSTIPKDFPFKSLSESDLVTPIEWKMFDELKDGEFKFNNKVHVVGWNKDKTPLYKGCPECNKKLIELSEDQYRCDKCRKDISSFNWRIILDVKFADATDHRYATCFNNAAETLLGKTAREIAELYKEDSESLDEFFRQNILFEIFHVQFRTKMETYNKVEKQKFQVDRINCLHLESYIQDLRDQLRSFEESEF